MGKYGVECRCGTRVVSRGRYETIEHFFKHLKEIGWVCVNGKWTCPVDAEDSLTKHQWRPIPSHPTTPEEQAKAAAILEYILSGKAAEDFSDWAGVEWDRSGPGPGESGRDILHMTFVDPEEESG